MNDVGNTWGPLPEKACRMTLGAHGEENNWKAKPKKNTINILKKQRKVTQLLGALI